MTKLFETEHAQHNTQNFLYDVRHPEEILYVIFILNDRLDRITLTESQMSVTYKDNTFGIVYDHVLLNAVRVAMGKNEMEGLSFYVLPAQALQTHFLVLDNQELVIHNQNEHRA